VTIIFSFFFVPPSRESSRFPPPPFRNGITITNDAELFPLFLSGRTKREPLPFFFESFGLALAWNDEGVSFPFFSWHTTV